MKCIGIMEIQQQCIKKIVFIFILLNCDVICAASVANSWILFAKALKDSWSICPVEVSFSFGEIWLGEISISKICYSLVYSNV